VAPESRRAYAETEMLLLWLLLGSCGTCEVLQRTLVSKRGLGDSPNPRSQRRDLGHPRWLLRLSSKPRITYPNGRLVCLVTRGANKAVSRHP
jgi:hypothetical protein